jgi:prolyl-tRNA synthetase
LLEIYRSLISFLKGVPLRLEIGPQDLKKSQTLTVRRDTGTKNPLALSTITQTIPQFLEEIQRDMFDRAKKTYDERIVQVTQWEELVPALDKKCVVVMPWCEEMECEDEIKDRSARG